MNMEKASSYPIEIESTAKDAVRILDSTKEEYLKFLNEIDRRESWSRIHNPSHDLPRGSIIRDKYDKKDILISLSSIQPIKIGKRLVYVFLSPYEIYANPKGTYEWFEAVVEIPASQQPELSKDYELLEPHVDDFVSLRSYIKSDKSLSNPKFREEKPVKKKVGKKTVKKETETKKKSLVVGDIIDLDALMGTPSKEKPDVEKTSAVKDDLVIEDVGKRKKIAKTIESIREARKIVEEGKSKVEEALARESEERSIREVAKISNTLRDIAVNEINKMGYSFSESGKLADSLQIHIDDLAISIHNKRMNLNAATKILTSELIKNKIKAPPKEVEKKKSKEGVIPKYNYADPTQLLEMACLWIMSSYGQNTTRSYELCKDRRGDIKRIADKMRSGRTTLMEAVKELEMSILENSPLTTIITEYKEPVGEEKYSTIALSESKRKKISAAAKKSAFVETLRHTPMSKEINTMLGLDVRREIQGRATDRVKQIMKTSSAEVSVHLRKQSAIIVEFQCYRDKTKGLGRSECYERYVSKILDEYGITAVNAPNGWHAHFSARTLPDGSIKMSQGDKDFDNFFDMINEIKKKYDEPKEVLVYLDSYIDKSEYYRVK